MSLLSEKDIKSFQAICTNRFGKSISKEEALERGVRFLRLMELVYKPITKEQLKVVLKRCQKLSIE